MEKLSFKLDSSPAKNPSLGISVGVVNSGNLEILLARKHLMLTETVVEITTTVNGYAKVWQAVLADFCAKYQIGGLILLINDAGATPAVVSLRLRQLYEKFNASTLRDFSHSRYQELNARERVLALSDEDSFREWLKPIEEIVSPHLAQLGLPCSFDDGMIIGKSLFLGRQIFIASQNYAFMGGAIGEVNGAKLAGLCFKALKDKPQAVILLLDSGGVRLQEANAGEIAISEVIAAIMQLRLSGIPIFGIVAGKNGAFGGIGIIAQCLDGIILTENARTGVSGPEVIETVMGTAEYDSSDRALVWRTCGGRHRALMGDGYYAPKEIAGIKDKLKDLLANHEPLNLAMLEAENQLLAERYTSYLDCRDGSDIWSKLGFTNAKEMPDLSDVDFIKLLK